MIGNQALNMKTPYIIVSKQRLINENQPPNQPPNQNLNPKTKPQIENKLHDGIIGHIKTFSQAKIVYQENLYKKSEKMIEESTPISNNSFKTNDLNLRTPRTQEMINIQAKKYFDLISTDTSFKSPIQWLEFFKGFCKQDDNSPKILKLFLDLTLSLPQKVNNDPDYLDLWLLWTYYQYVNKLYFF